MATNLREAGIELEFSRPDHSGRRMVTIRAVTRTWKSWKSSSAPSALNPAKLCPVAFANAHLKGSLAFRLAGQAALDLRSRCGSTTINGERENARRTTNPEKQKRNLRFRRLDFPPSWAGQVQIAATSISTTIRALPPKC